MDLFLKAKTIRLKTYNDKYLIAEDDRETISQARDGSIENSLWMVEFTEGKDCIRLKSCFETYLTASNTPIIPGVTAKKVIQTQLHRRDPATQWETLRDGMQVRLRSLWGNFLHPNGGIPPWRNSVTHDIPHLSTTLNKILWDVEVVETQRVNQHLRTLSDVTFDKLQSFSASIDPKRRTVNDF